MTEVQEQWSNIEALLSSNDECWKCLYQLRYPTGYRCSDCSHKKAWISKDRWIHCAACGVKVSVTSDTVFARTRKPLSLWMRAVYLMATEDSLNAKDLQRLLGLGSYETAWLWLHRLRQLMADPLSRRLGGTVLVGHNFVRYKKHRRHSMREVPIGKAMLFVGAEIQGNKIIQIRMEVASLASDKDYESFIVKNIAQGSTIINDGWTWIRNLTRVGYKHKVPWGDSFRDMPDIRKATDNFSGWLLNVYKRGISREHLGVYLDEYTFKHNHCWGSGRSRTNAFYLLLKRFAQRDIRKSKYRSLIKNIRKQRTQTRPMPW